MTSNDVLTASLDLFQNLWPFVLALTVVIAANQLMKHIKKIMWDAGGYERQDQRKRKPKSDFYYPMDGIEYETANGYLLPKRKNDQPVRLGDDGELIYPDSDHIEE